MELLHKDKTDRIIRAFYNVYNNLGYGFLEKVYENGLMIELSNTVKTDPPESFNPFDKRTDWNTGCTDLTDMNRSV